MLYIEIGTGGLAGSGSARLKCPFCSVVVFATNDTLYDIAKARRGKLEKVVIKATRPITPKPGRTIGKMLYVDTFNGLWNEWDLVPYEVALGLVVTYKQRIANEARELYDT